jgi:hypothetical protein
MQCKYEHSSVQHIGFWSHSCLPAQTDSHIGGSLYKHLDIDLSCHFPSLKDDELAGRMGLQPKELNKVIAVLSNDSLVKVYVYFPSRIRL